MSQAIVQRARAKLRSAIGDEPVLRLNITGDLQEMLDALEIIQPVLEKAEMQLLVRNFSTGWLQHVRHAAYRIMDMVDELQDTRQPTAATMTRMPPRLAIKMNATKNEIIRLKEYWHSYISVKEVAFTQLRQQVMDERATIPCLEEASVVGRASDKQNIVAVLQSAASNIIQGSPRRIILPIFGFAGSGKSTLAQMVFNDDGHSLQQYNCRVWVYVSPELNFYEIGESILYQVMSGEGEKEKINDHCFDPDAVGMAYIMKCLNELLKGKKVLLVLDDLWEEDPIQLQLLKCMLTFLGDKVDVIVTTNNHAIAMKICTVEPYRLNPLGDDVCWQIIKKSVRFKVQVELGKIQLEMASSCWGLPSVAQAFAGILDLQDPRKWIWISERDDWKYTWKGWDYFLGDDLESRLLISTLELSYMSMPPDLRLCFAYFSIFPIGHNIVKDDLIHQWIALHLIEPTEKSMSATQIAEEYITRLLDMSFLQTTKLDPARVTDDKSTILFTMHDLAHILAPILRGSDHYMLKTNHYGNLGNDVNARALRCVGCNNVQFNDDSFSSRRCLRVLELQESSVQKLPDSIWQLRYLRYLKITDFSGLVTLPESLRLLTNLIHIDLSGCSGLVNLPVSIGELICLLHVNLSGCSGLATLPESFGKLIHLVHVNLSGCSTLATLPESFGNLVNLLHMDLSGCHRLVEILQTLKKLVKLVYLDLSSWSCFKGIDKYLVGLTNLEHLNLSNPCCYLPQHRSHLQRLKGGLCKLTSLRYLNLSMCLNPILYYHKSQEESLKYIQSCVSGLSSLENLDLSHNTFLAHLPQSLGNLDKLHTLDLSGCIRLKKLGEMKALRFIALRNCRSLESCNFAVRVIDDGDSYRSGSNIIQLEDVDCEVLQISCLEKVRSKEEAQRIKLVEKQKLEKLKLSWTLDSVRSVEDSALLGELTPPLHVQCLELNGYDGTRLPEYLGDLASLQELKIKCCKQLISLPDSIRKLSNLKDLLISDCPGLEKWCKLDENKKMLPHILKKNHEEHASTSRPEIKEDSRLFDEMEAA